MQGERPGGTEQLAELARQTDAAQRTAETGGGSGEPDFVRRRRPGQTVGAGPTLGEIRLLAGEIDYAYDSAVIAQKRMVDERQAIAFWREAEVADPARGFVEHFADGELQAALTADLV